MSVSAVNGTIHIFDIAMWRRVGRREGQSLIVRATAIARMDHRWGVQGKGIAAALVLGDETVRGWQHVARILSDGGIRRRTDVGGTDISATGHRFDPQLRRE